MSTNAAASHPNVKALVDIAAFIPDAGENAYFLATQFPGSQIVPPGVPRCNVDGPSIADGA